MISPFRLYLIYSHYLFSFCLLNLQLPFTSPLLKLMLELLSDQKVLTLKKLMKLIVSLLKSIAQNQNTTDLYPSFLSPVYHTIHISLPFISMNWFSHLWTKKKKNFNLLCSMIDLFYKPKLFESPNFNNKSMILLPKIQSWNLNLNKNHIISSIA